MNNILIIEDDEDKANHLTNFVNEYLPRYKVIIAKSLQTGMKAALYGNHCIILLDMTLTNFDRTLLDDGGRPHPFAGREILRQLTREGVNTPVIVVTQFGRFGEKSEELSFVQLKDDLSSKFTNYIGIVKYKSNVDDWKKQLKILIDKSIGQDT